MDREFTWSFTYRSTVFSAVVTQFTKKDTLMASAKSTQGRVFRRLATGLATAVAALGLFAFIQFNGDTSKQADEPWACDRTGTTCYDY
jgi:hypothetical protein